MKLSEQCNLVFQVFLSREQKYLDHYQGEKCRTWFMPHPYEHGWMGFDMNTEYPAQIIAIRMHRDFYANTYEGQIIRMLNWLIKNHEINQDQVICEAWLNIGPGAPMYIETPLIYFK